MTTSGILRRFLLGCFLLSLAPVANGAEPLREPLQDYRDAAELVKQGRRAEALFPFYRGLMRERIRLVAHPELQAAGELDVMVSLDNSFGKALDEWAHGDRPLLLRTLNEVIAWHAANDDPWTPKAQFPGAHRTILDLMEEMRLRVAMNGDDMRADRGENGLEKRVP